MLEEIPPEVDTLLAKLTSQAMVEEGGGRGGGEEGGGGKGQDSGVCVYGRGGGSH